MPVRTNGRVKERARKGERERHREPSSTCLFAPTGVSERERESARERERDREIKGGVRERERGRERAVIIVPVRTKRCVREADLCKY